MLLTFWLNGATVEGNLKNLIIIILNERCFTKAIIVDLPTNNETFRAITGHKYELARNEIM